MSDAAAHIRENEGEMPAFATPIHTRNTAQRWRPAVIIAPTACPRVRPGINDMVQRCGYLRPADGFVPDRMMRGQNEAQLLRDARSLTMPRAHLKRAAWQSLRWCGSHDLTEVWNSWWYAIDFDEPTMARGSESDAPHGTPHEAASCLHVALAEAITQGSDGFTRSSDALEVTVSATKAIRILHTCDKVVHAKLGLDEGPIENLHTITEHT